MRKFLALCSLALLFAVPAFARELATDNLHWLTHAAATVGNSGASDSLSFRSDGAAAANRDTAWVPVGGVAPHGGPGATVADSTIYARITIKPKVGSSVSPGADSLYCYLEGIAGDGVFTGLLTNLTELLVLESGTGNTFTWKLTWARAALALEGFERIGLIVRGDYNGEYEGTISYYTDKGR